MAAYQFRRALKKTPAALHPRAAPARPALRPAGVPRFLQAKLRVSQPGDVYEQQAEQVAEALLRGEGMTGDSAPASLRIAALAAGSGGAELTPTFEADFASRRGAGSPLPAAERAFFEPRFGADLGTVRLHTDRGADQLSRTLNADAFTVGQDIYVAGGYAPGSAAGRGLLAHELTHVVQQQASQAPDVLPRRKSRAPTGTVEGARGTTAIEGEVISASRPKETTGWVEGAEGLQPIEGEEIAASPEATRADLDAEAGKTNQAIQVMVDASINNVVNGIQNAVFGFDRWYRARGRKPNSAAFAVDVLSAAFTVLGAAYKPASVAAAVVRGVLQISKDRVARAADANVEPDRYADQVGQVMLNFSDKLVPAFQSFGKQLHENAPDIWYRIGLALAVTPHREEYQEDVRRELYTNAGVPRPGQNYTEQILSAMIFAYLDWEYKRDLKSSVLFTNPSAVAWAFASPEQRQRWAAAEAKQRLSTGQ